MLLNGLLRSMRLWRGLFDEKLSFDNPETPLKFFTQNIIWKCSKIWIFVALFVYYVVFSPQKLRLKSNMYCFLCTCFNGLIKKDSFEMQPNMRMFKCSHCFNDKFWFFFYLLSGCCYGSSRRFLTDFLQEFPTPGTGPYFDSTIPSNITGLVGKNVHLVCKVKNLGNRTVCI